MQGVHCKERPPLHLDKQVRWAPQRAMVCDICELGSVRMPADINLQLPHRVQDAGIVPEAEWVPLDPILHEEAAHVQDVLHVDDELHPDLNDVRPPARLHLDHADSIRLHSHCTVADE